MGAEHSLKKISAAGVAAALKKAETYRLLNDPEQAESICLDVLEIEADNETAKQTLILALTDQFASTGATSKTKMARGLAAALTSEYLRHYFAGIIAEREGRAYLVKGLRGSFAYECLAEAMEHFENAEAHRPEGNDEAILRYNSCVRTIVGLGLERHVDDGELPLE